MPSSPESIARADIVVGHEFAAPALGSETPGAINEAIAEMVVQYAGQRLLYAAETVADAIEHLDRNVKVKVLTETTSDTAARVGGTEAELQQVWDHIGGLRSEVRSLHIGHAYHIGRVVQQARRMGFYPRVPEGLPTAFDPESRQWWCRDKTSWQLREAVGVPYLELKSYLNKL